MTIPRHRGSMSPESRWKAALRTNHSSQYWAEFSSHWAMLPAQKHLAMGHQLPDCLRLWPDCSLHWSHQAQRKEWWLRGIDFAVDLKEAPAELWVEEKPPCPQHPMLQSQHLLVSLVCNFSASSMEWGFALPTVRKGNWAKLGPRARTQLPQSLFCLGGVLPCTSPGTALHSHKYTWFPLKQVT